MQITIKIAYDFPAIYGCFPKDVQPKSYQFVTIDFDCGCFGYLIEGGKNASKRV